jgi:hypothetical protein
MRRVSFSGFCKSRFVVAIGTLTLALGFVAIGQPPLPQSDDESVQTCATCSEPSGGEELPQEIAPDEGDDAQAADVAALQVCPQPDPDPNGAFPVWQNCPPISASFHDNLTIPVDKDNDYIADRWELEKVREWNTQYGTNEPVGLTFFELNSDKELEDPDGAGNTDGGENLPTHKALTFGDSLLAWTEYRGAIFDGGGQDWVGSTRFTAFGMGGTVANANFAGGHVRLSPSFKELQVETDLMSNVAHMPTVTDIRNILNGTATGFSERTNGLGIRMFFAVDDTAAPHELFSGFADLDAWATNQRNNRMLSFVHLMFADKTTDMPRQGTSQTFGSYVFVETNWQDATNPIDSYNFQAGLTSTAGHELTHLLLNENNTSGFDNTEHLPNPNPADAPRFPLHYKYLMDVLPTEENRETMIFSASDRISTNMRSKQSVER